MEIGRFKGGSTFITAAAMAPGSALDSYDLHVALRDDLQGPDLDRELTSALERYGLGDRVRLVVADSRSVPLPDPGLGLLFVDGDHLYEGAAADLQRWSPLVRPGGHVVMHDAVDTGGYGNVYPGSGERFSMSSCVAETSTRHRRSGRWLICYGGRREQ